MEGWVYLGPSLYLSFRSSVFGPTEVHQYLYSLSVCLSVSQCLSVHLSVAVSLVRSRPWVPVKCASISTVSVLSRTCWLTSGKWRTWLWLANWTSSGEPTWLREADCRPVHYKGWWAAAAAAAVVVAVVTCCCYCRRTVEILIQSFI